MHLNKKHVKCSECERWSISLSNHKCINNKEIIKPAIDNSYMLLFEKSEYKTSPYRSYLSQNAKQLTSYDFLTGVVEYNRSNWKLN
jgi:hypothetical protein